MGLALQLLVAPPVITPRRLQCLAVALALIGLAPVAADAAILKRVHSGTATSIPAGGTSITLELADASKAVVYCTTRTTNTDTRARATCVLSDNNLLIDVGSNAGGIVSVGWYVAEFESGVSVQRNTASFASGGTSVSVTLSPAVDCSKSFVVMAGVQNDDASGNNDDERHTILGILGTVGSPCGVTAGTTTSTLTVSRLESGIAATAAWQVVTMDGATVMERDTVTIGNSALTTTATIASTDSTRAFLSMSYQVGSGVAGNEPQYLTRGDFSSCSGSPLSCTGLTFTRQRQTGSSNTHVQIAYEVVQLEDGGTVQRGSTTSSGTTTTMGGSGNISAIDRSAAVPFFTASVTGNSAAFLDDGSWSAAFPSTTQLQFTRGSNVSTVGTANWFVTSFYKCANSRLCSVAATGGNATATVTWSPIYDPQCLSSSTPTACQALVVRDTSAITWAPTNGTSYTVGNQPAGGPATMRVAFNGTGQSFSQSGLTNGTQYFYRVYPRINGGNNYITDSGMTQAISQVSVTPSASLAWSYMTTGGSTLNAPIMGDGRLYVASNGNKVVALDSASGAEVATPVITNGAVQSYLTWLPVSAGGEAVIAGDQNGWLTRIDGVTGARVWVRKMGVDSGGFLQASVSAQLRASATCDGGSFNGTYSVDQLYVVSRNASQSNNRVWAVPLDADGQGALSWTYPVTGGSPAIDRAAGQPFVDYCRNRLWVTTGAGSGGNQPGVWVINTLNGNLIGSINPAGDLTNTSPLLSGDTNTVWMGNSLGYIGAVDTGGSPSVKYSLLLGGTTPTISGFIWEDWATSGRLYVPVTVGGTAGVWCVQDTGAALSPCSDWPTNPRLVAAGAVSQPLVTGTAIFFPASNGRIYQINTSDGQLYLGTGTPFTVESGTALGGISTDDHTQLFVGTSTGRTYRINLNGGNLP